MARVQHDSRVIRDTSALPRLRWHSLPPDILKPRISEASDFDKSIVSLLSTKRLMVKVLHFGPSSLFTIGPASTLPFFVHIDTTPMLYTNWHHGLPSR